MEDYILKGNSKNIIWVWKWKSESEVSQSDSLLPHSL